jgi:uncharacterized ferredoxin-like protein
MVQTNSQQIEKNAVNMVAALMAAGSRTAPKTRGLDSTATLFLEGDDLEKLAVAMDLATYRRDAKNVRKSACVLLIGVTGEPKKIEQPLDCGACGYASCEHLAKARKKMLPGDFGGPVCMFQSIDLGIALGSAVKLAADLCPRIWDSWILMLLWVFRWP